MEEEAGISTAACVSDMFVIIQKSDNNICNNSMSIDSLCETGDAALKYRERLGRDNLHA